MMTKSTPRVFLCLATALMAVSSWLTPASAQAPSGPQPRTGRFSYGAGDDPTYQAFVIPLDFQKGVQLSPTGIAPWASGLDYNAYPWFFKITGQSSFLIQNNSGTVTYPLEVQNPIAGFGSESGGTPLYIGQSSRFALHTGGQSAATDVPDEMSIRVYRRSDFAQQGNVVPVQVQALDIPHWKSASATNSAAEWKQFGDNGFQKTFVTTVSGVQVLETTVQLALEAGPDGMFGAGYSAPFIITHRALPGAENYYFSVAAVGNTMVGSNAHWMAVSDPAQPGTSGTFVVGYALNFESAPPWGTTLVKTPHFQGEPAPPTYHGKTAEEIQALTPRFEHQFVAPAGSTYTQLNQAPELQGHTILDRFVSEMGSNPMALVNYVHNEIGLTDALGYNENGDIDEAAVNAGGINRSALATFQEGQGSPDEQCALLVYLLRKAGVHASYVRSSPNAVKMLDQRLSNLLRMRLKGLQTPDGTQPVPQLIGVNYPWVAAYVNVDGVNKWVHLFPWLKDTEVVEGLAVEGYLPSGTKSIREWVRKYLKAEANDALWTLDAEDRTPGNIFLKDLDKSLQQNWPGLAKDSLGVRFRNRKFNRVQWKEFPQPTQFNTTTGTYTQSDRVSANGSRFDTVDIEIVNDQDTNKKITLTGLRLADLHNRRAVINFLPGTTGNYTMRFAMEPYDLDNVAAGTGDFTTGSDPYLLRRQVKDVAVTNTHKNYKFKVVYHRQRNYGGPVGVADQNLLGGWAHFAGINNIDFGPGGGATASSPSVSVFGLGDLNAFCLNAGRVTDRMLKVHLEPFWKHEQARAADANLAADYDLIQGTTAYLMGMSYYQRVSRSFDTLKDLFKVHTVSMRAHGFAQFGAKRDGSGNPVVANAPLPNSQTTKRVEQIYPVVDMNFSRTAWAGYGDVRPDAGGQGMITGADFMTNLYIAEISSLEDHTIQQYVSVEDTDAVSTVNLIHRIQQDGNAATNVIELTADNYLTEKTKTYAFGGSTKTLAAWAGGLWTSVEAAFAGWDKNLARVYITPGPVAGAGGNWKGMGALIIGKSQAGALIGQINGGWGGSFFTGSSSYVYDDWSWSTTALSSTTSSSSWGGSTSYSSNLWSDTSSSISMSLGSSLWGSSVSQSSYTSLSQSTSLWSGMSTSLGGGDSFLSYTDQYFMGGAGLSGGSLSSSYDSYLSMPALTSTSWTIGSSIYGSSFADIGLGSNWMGDPVHMVTGELYADEVDLTLPGTIPLEVRRNYSSQSSHAGSFGFGWKMAYFPYIVPTDSDAKLQVAELDGSVLIYARNTANTTAEEWIVKAEDNPHLSNGSGMEIGSVRNLLRNRILRTSPGGISTYTLYGVDGSTRVYEVRSYPAYGTSPVINRQRPYLKRWTDSVGNYLDFKFYGDGVSGDPWYVPGTHSSYGELARVQSSNGNFFGFRYNTSGHIVEIFAGDGRRISYRYDDQGDLLEVTRPDNSWLRYEYLHEQGKVGSTNNLAWYSTHLIKKEVRPGGRIVESDYQLYAQGDKDAEGNTIGAGSDKIGKASHLRRVTLQRAAVGKHNGANDRTQPAAESYEPVRNATYTYYNTKDAAGMITGRTEILDAYNRKTIYYYTNNRLTKVFDPASTVTNAATGAGSNPKMEQEWYTAQDVTNGVSGAYGGALKAMQNRGGARAEYFYNSSGDVVEIRSLGDLDGDGVATDVAVTTATYNSLHLADLIRHPDPTTGLATGRRTKYYYGDSSRPYLITRVEQQDSAGNVLSASTNSYYDVFSNPGSPSQVPFAKGLVQTTKVAEGSVDEAVTGMEHDARGFVTKRTGYSGQGDQTNYPNLVTQYLHNLRGEMVEERVMDGATAKKINRNAYDDMGRPIWVERLNEAGQQIAWDYTYYTLNGEVEWTDSSRTNPEDYTFMRYDGAGRPVEQVAWRSRAKADGSGVEAVPGLAQFSTTKFYYNLFGDLIKTMDPRGHTVKAAYDEIGRKTVTEAYQGDWQNGGVLLARELTAYDDALRKVTQTDARGGVTQTFFTSDGKPRRQINPDGTQLEWRYYLDGRVRREPASEHLYHEFTYNDTTRTVTKTVKNGNGQTLASESYVSDRRGNQVSVTNMVGHTATSTFDKLNRSISTSVPAAGSSSAAQSSTAFYDAAGMKRRILNSLGEHTETLSDALGRPVSTVVRNAANVILSQSSMSYSADFNRLTTTSGTGAGQLTRTVWTDNAGKNVLEKHADGTFARTEYDAVGNAVASTDETGQVTMTNYDALNRVAMTLLPDGAMTQFSYAFPGGGGQRIERLMPRSLKEVAITDVAGRPVESYLEAEGVKSRRYLGYQYFPSGKEKGLLQQYTDPRGIVHCMTYDDWQRPASVTVGIVGNPTYVKREMLSYDVRGQVTQLKESTATGVTEILSAYDGQGHLEYEKVKLNGTVATHLVNTYDGAGRRGGLARGGDVSPVGSGVGGSWGFGYRADGLLAQVTFGGSAFNYTYEDNGLLKTRSNAFRTYTVPSSGGRDSRGRLLAAQTRLTGRSVDVVGEAVTWTSDSRQASHTATRLTANDGTGTATWQDARNYQYSTQRRQLASESWVPGAGQAGKTQGHEHDFGQAGGLGIYTGRQAPAPAGSTGDQLFLVNDAGMEGGAGISAFGRVTREVSGFETLGLTAQGTAKGAKNVELTVNNNSRLSEVEFEAATRFSTGAWSRQLWLPAGGYNLLAKGNHPSGQFSGQATAAFNLGVRHFGVETLYDEDGNVTHRHIAGGFAQNGRSQSLTWDGLGRLVKMVQEEFGGFGYEWTATYDGLNRRLQTTYVPKRGNLYQPSEQVVERSWHDPLVEFLEVGLEVVRGLGTGATMERWWKVHGPDLSGGYGGLEGMGGLEAMVSEATGEAVGMMDDVYGHIVGYAKAAGLGAAASGALTYEWNDARFGGYGPLSGTWSASLADGLSVWRAFGWRGKRLDVTGFYHLGARYYEPNSGRFLSIDPMGHEASMSLYDYAGGDPINFIDPSGRDWKSNAWSFAKGFGKALVVGAVVTAAIIAAPVVLPAAAVTAVVATVTVVGVASTAVTGYEIVSGKEAFSGRQLADNERWERGGEFLGGFVGGKISAKYVPNMVASSQYASKGQAWTESYNQRALTQVEARNTGVTREVGVRTTDADGMTYRPRYDAMGRDAQTNQLKGYEFKSTRDADLTYAQEWGYPSAAQNGGTIYTTKAPAGFGKGDVLGPLPYEVIRPVDLFMLETSAISRFGMSQIETFSNLFDWGGGSSSVIQPDSIGKHWKF